MTKLLIMLACILLLINTNLADDYKIVDEAKAIYTEVLNTYVRNFNEYTQIHHQYTFSKIEVRLKENNDLGVFAKVDIKVRNQILFILNSILIIGRRRLNSS